ncbi:TPA: hypothetical protein ACXIJH_001297 [Serratia marcescens]
MTFSEEQRINKMSTILSTQRRLLEDLERSSVFYGEKEMTYYSALLNYIENNQSINLYTIPVLREATKCLDDHYLLDIVQYFGGGNSRLFTIHYCYYQESDLLDIDPVEFKEYQLNKIEPVDINGNEIEDFNPNYLSFYCLINYDELNA